MIINKLVEFAKDGDKSISGLSIITGFPRQQKPYRQWMNYLFNLVFYKTNEIIGEVNAINKIVEPLTQPIAVGEGFFTVNDYRSPQEVAEIKGYGTWRRFAEGRTLVGYSDSEESIDDYRIMGNEFGTNEEQLSISQMPKHKHAYKASHEGGVGALNDPTGFFSTNSSEPIIKHDSSNPDGTSVQLNGNGNNLYSEGGDQPHNNTQPSVVVAYWLRTE